MNKRHKAELRAGLFLNLGLALLMLVLFLFGSKLNIFSSNISYHFVVPNAQGLLAGAKVLIAGVDAGKVDSFSVDPDTRAVRVEVDIFPKFQNFMREDSFADLTTQGILGDKVVNITPGTQTRPLIEPNGELPVQLSTSLFELVGKGDRLVTDLDKLILNVNETLGSIAPGAKGSLAKLDTALNRLNSIFAKIDSGNGTVGALINDPQLYDDAKSLVGETNNNRIVRNLIRKSIADSEARQAENQAGQAGN